MTENKRFELKVNQHNQCDIVDLVESKEKNAICIYNDLGDYYFSSAKALCELLNELHDTNQELYDFRLVLNALLFNEWAENKKYEVYKSKRHSDGKLCFDGEWFVVVAILPTGQVTNHYHVKYWDYFKIPSYEKVKDEFDGHTSTDVLIRYGLMFND